MKFTHRITRMKFTHEELVTLRQACLTLRQRRLEQAEVARGLGAREYAKKYDDDADRAVKLYVRLCGET